MFVTYFTSATNLGTSGHKGEELKAALKFRTIARRLANASARIRYPAERRAAYVCRDGLVRFGP